MQTDLSSHDGHLSCRPRVVEVAPHMLGVHDTVRATVRLACNHGDLGHGRLGVREYQLRSMANYAVVLLVRSCAQQYHSEHWRI